MTKQTAVRGSILLFPGRYLGKSATRQKNKRKIPKLCVIHIFFFINEQEGKLLFQ